MNDAPNAAPELVSVVVRSMDRPSLGAALASIAEQDYPRVEIVVVAASGSAHGPLPATAGRHPVRGVPSPVPLARPAAANAGLDAARGDWITFLDDDDAMLAGHLAGLMAAHARRPDVEVIHSRGRALRKDGSIVRLGHPLNVMQLYERNFTQLATVVFARTLLARGVRFDESLPVFEDWDFLLQLAQIAAFEFVPQDLVQWNAEAGDSGVGHGANRDDAQFTRCRDLVYAKWAPQRDALMDQVESLLRASAALAQRGDYAGAEAHVRDALRASPNNPWALNLRASIERTTGRLAQARRTQELAVAVRSYDPSLLANLALIYRAEGEIDRARRCCDEALALDPAYEPALKLRAALPA